eukprot:scaffold10659_cov96-Isochrysis_galbana.AAC.3
MAAITAPPRAQYESDRRATRRCTGLILGAASGGRNGSSSMNEDVKCNMAIRATCANAQTRRNSNAREARHPSGDDASREKFTQMFSERTHTHDARTGTGTGARELS